MAKKVKTKTVFFCTSCGHESAKWMGQPTTRWCLFRMSPARIPNDWKQASGNWIGYWEADWCQDPSSCWEENQG